MKLHDITIHELHESLKKREIKSRDIVESVLNRIQEKDESIKAYVTVKTEEALKTADEADKIIQSGKPFHPLTGIPVAIKDNMCTIGVRTTCSSRILENYIPPYDATVVSKLKKAGAVIVGKTNMDEFAMGSSTENSGFFPTKNPYDLSKVPGGSSGGSAASVAAGEAIAALGSDTGGSIRQPAALCGVVGMKPTYGRVSRYGLVAFASSLDQIGPITRDVMDCAVVLNTISGHDPLDSTSVDIDIPDYLDGLSKGIEGLRIGIPGEYFIEGMDGQVEKSIWDAVKIFEEAGVKCERISLPHTDHAVATYYIIAPSEASSNLARYDGVKYGYRAYLGSDIIQMYSITRAEGFGAEVKRRIMLGTYALSSGYYDAYYLKAQRVRTLIKNDFQEAFKKCDVIVCPTSPTPAFGIGEKVQDPLQMYLSDIFTISVNLAGIPGISIPCGFTTEGLPIGLQIIGRPFDEETILRVAYAFEQRTDYHKIRVN